MKIHELLQQWEDQASGQLTPQEYTVQLPLDQAAKLQALAEMYPRHSLSNIITDLLCAALEDVESNLPYVRGETIISRDERGDPLYEDVGPTPRYLNLTKKHMQDFLQGSKSPH